ncbi:ATP-binding cassette domain-containing protein [Thermodesulfobacteriota bacterium]
MNLITLQDVSISYGGHPILDRINLQIQSGERICLVGRNGEGKSTLVKILAKEITPDSGNIICKPGLKTTTLSQEVPRDLSGTVHEVVAAGLGDLNDLLTKHHTLSIDVSTSNDPTLLKQLESVQHELDMAGGWQARQSIEMVLSRLGLVGHLQFSELSGGMKRRVLLARALVDEPDILLLDEPTNHLDLDSILWLEEFLLSYDHTILFITHDRSLARKLATRILDLDRGNLTSWPKTYDEYLRHKDELLDIALVHNRKFDKKLSQEETWIRQGIKARRTRNEGRVRALLKLREERAARRELSGKARLTLQEADRSGRLVVKVRNVSYGLDEVPIIDDFSTTILRGDKVGIIGPNGCGKTTLLKILLGKISLEQGQIESGTNLHIAYYDQLREQIDEDKTVAQNVGEGKEIITIHGRDLHIISYLKSFLFTPDRARSPVHMLSGGERNRLLLARLLSRPANVLVLDEPTNDLDVETLELLEELLHDFKGTVLLVSHDRTFLNNIATSTLVFEGQGNIREYTGGYDDWLRQKKYQEITGPPLKSSKQIPSRRKQERPKKLTFKEKAELSELPGKIETMEAEQQELFDLLGDPTFYQQSGENTGTVKARLNDLETALESAYHRWEELESLPK